MRILTIKLSILPDHELSETASLHTRKHWLVISGHGEILRNGLYTAARTGDSFTISREEQHGIRAHTAMELIEIRMLCEGDAESIYT